MATALLRVTVVARIFAHTAMVTSGSYKRLRFYIFLEFLAPKLYLSLRGYAYMPLLAHLL